MPSTLKTVKDIAGGLALLATGFGLGTIYANWSYDYYLLWVSPTPAEWVELAAKHYAIKASQPAFLHHVLHVVLAIGILSLVAKLYRASESNTLFDGGSIVLFVIAVVFYVANLRPASHSVITGDWNDIDEDTGVKMIAATQVLIVFVLLGVVALQFGQAYAEMDVARISEAAAADRKQAEAETAGAASATETATAEATGSKKSSTAASKKGKQ